MCPMAFLYHPAQGHPGGTWAIGILIINYSSTKASNGTLGTGDDDRLPQLHCDQLVNGDGSHSRWRKVAGMLCSCRRRAPTSAALGKRDVVAAQLADVDLTWADALLFGVLDHLKPLGEPSGASG
jgi:hypothetical protein